MLRTLSPSRSITPRARGYYQASAQQKDWRLSAVYTWPLTQPTTAALNLGVSFPCLLFPFLFKQLY